jgi:hypothetical protein
MALSTSFTGGWFYGGQFFDEAVAGWFRGTEELAKHIRQRTAHDIVRSRGRFQVFTTAQDIISQLAEQLVDEDDEQIVLKKLREAIDEHHIDWQPQYLQQLLDERETLPAWQERLEKKKAAAHADWLRRRQQKLRMAR